MRMVNFFLKVLLLGTSLQISGEKVKTGYNPNLLDTPKKIKISVSIGGIK
jgi:peptidylprolyl isomerase